MRCVVFRFRAFSDPRAVADGGHTRRAERMRAKRDTKLLQLRLSWPWQVSGLLRSSGRGGWVGFLEPSGEAVARN